MYEASEIRISAIVGRIRWVYLSIPVIQKSPLRFGVSDPIVAIGRLRIRGFADVRGPRLHVAVEQDQERHQ